MSILFTIQPLVHFVFFEERNMLLLLDLKRNHKLTSGWDRSSDLNWRWNYPCLWIERDSS